MTNRRSLPSQCPGNRQDGHTGHRRGTRRGQEAEAKGHMDKSLPCGLSRKEWGRQVRRLGLAGLSFQQV
jgi:hypothetical protein